MSNIVTIDFNAVPAFAKQKSAVAEALGGSLDSGIRRLSIKGGTFRYIAGGQEIGKIDERHIDLVFVNAAPHIARTYYAKKYDGDSKPEAPNCWSVDGTVPDPKVKNPQSANCLSCPQNQKNSGQGESKACRYSQRLAVVLANDIGGEVLQLQLPATSIWGDNHPEYGAPLQNYYKALKARSIDPGALVTRARFNTDSESPKLGFTAIRWLTQEEYALATQQGSTEAAQRAVTMTVFEVDGVDATKDVPLPSGTPPATPAAAPAPALAAVKSAEIKVESNVAMPSTPEPVVRKSSDAVSAASNPKLAQLVKEWTDDTP